MSDAYVIDVLAGALQTAAWIAGPILIASLAIGVFVSILQTVLQIQEQTLTFVPKLGGIALVVLVAGGWMLQVLTDWVDELWRTIPGLT